MRHIELAGDTGQQDDHRQPAELDGFGESDFFHRALQQFKAHEQDQHGHHQAGEVFHPSVAKRMVGIGLLPSQLEAQNGHQTGPCIRQVIEGICRNGDGSADGAGKKLSKKQQDIQGDTHPAAQHAVLPANGRFGHLLIIFDEETGKNGYHRICTSQTEIPQEPFTPAVGISEQRQHPVALSADAILQTYSCAPHS